MPTVFGDFNIDDFWKPSEYAQKTYIAQPPSQEDVAAIERMLGYKLPTSYVELMSHQNGGIPRNTSHRTSEGTSWARDHIAISGIYSIGHQCPCSLGGEFTSQFWHDEWGYPPIGIYFADCPSAGHDMVCLDYRDCGREGFPRVVHVDQEFDYKITFVAKDFESFIRGLEPDEAFDDE